LSAFLQLFLEYHRKDILSNNFMGFLVGFLRIEMKKGMAKDNVVEFHHTQKGKG
jgi:hypothetical protein